MRNVSTISEGHEGSGEPIPDAGDLQSPEILSAEVSAGDIIEPVLIPDQSSSSGQRLTWAKSNIKEVKYNKSIQDHMGTDPAFSNWVRSCVMIHADNDMDESRCSLPDQFKDIGESITIVSMNAIPVRQGETHRVVEGIIHVMN